ncbi:peroxiredoxin family protein [Rubrobacter indicoceani]|uniref:peroxiredoxin family protein n=1 Tax=Rubrobacter indicoceani TaxID=2051957 RepID=UPI0013C51DD2|nr:redoxin domain-containing protein [Rubrobacter indicoceani]
MARIKNAPAPAVGDEAPDFNLSSAQGGGLRLGVRTVRGPVVVAFFGGTWSGDDVAFFEALAGKEDEINAALGSVVGVCVSEPEAAREFQKKVGLKSYVLYDYTMTATAAWGVLEESAEHGPHARSATFLVDGERRVAAAWPDARPVPDELLAAVSGITGLPKPEEPAGETADGEEGAEGKPARPRRTTRRAKKETEGEEGSGE